MNRSDLFDPVDSALLPILRHAVLAFQKPERQSWRLAYSTSAEVWGEARGLSIAHALADLLSHLVSRDRPFQCNDPLDLEKRESVTHCEYRVLLMLRFMRSDDTSNARKVIMELCEGKVPAAVVRSALTLATRLDHGTCVRRQAASPLRAVS